MAWSVMGSGRRLGEAVALVAAALFYWRKRGFQGGIGGASGPASTDLARPLTDLPVLVVDLETTGLDVRRDRVVSIGAVPGFGARLDRHGTLDMLVNPDQPVPARSTAIHGITNAMVADAPLFAEAFGKLDAMLTGRVMVGHNIGFDRAVLQSECKRLGVTWSEPPVLDLVRLAAALDPRERDLTLEAMADRWGITVSGRHTALGDALMAAEMWAYVLPRLIDIGVVTLGDALAFERRARAVIANQRRAGWH
jgi:DNA polymerase-3 subunit epsilon